GRGDPRAVQGADSRAPTAGRRRKRRDRRALARRSRAYAEARRRAQDERRRLARGVQRSRPLPHRLQAPSELARAHPRRRRELARALTELCRSTARPERGVGHTRLRRPRTTTTNEDARLPL